MWTSIWVKVIFNVHKVPPSTLIPSVTCIILAMGISQPICGSANSTTFSISPTTVAIIRNKHIAEIVLARTKVNFILAVYSLISLNSLLNRIRCI